MVSLRRRENYYEVVLQPPTTNKRETNKQTQQRIGCGIYLQIIAGIIASDYRFPVQDCGDRKTASHVVFKSLKHVLFVHGIQDGSFCGVNDYVDTLPSAKVTRLLQIF